VRANLCSWNSANVLVLASSASTSILPTFFKVNDIILYVSVSDGIVSGSRQNSALYVPTSTTCISLHDHRAESSADRGWQRSRLRICHMEKEGSRFIAITEITVMVNALFIRRKHDREWARTAQHQTIDCGARSHAISRFESSFPLALSFNPPRPQLAFSFNKVPKVGEIFSLQAERR
jgi:hypothetical protein